MLSVFGWIVRRTPTEVRDNGCIAGNAMNGIDRWRRFTPVQRVARALFSPGAPGLTNCTPTDTDLASVARDSNVFSCELSQPCSCSLRPGQARRKRSYGLLWYGEPIWEVFHASRPDGSGGS
jgi:hypothetical protein